MASPTSDRSLAPSLSNTDDASSSPSEIGLYVSSRSSQTVVGSSLEPDEFQRQRSGGIPRALSTFRSEMPASSYDSVRPLPTKFGVDVALQTEQSWLRDLYEKRMRKEFPETKGLFKEKIQETMAAYKKKKRMKNLRSALEKIAVVRAFGGFGHKTISPASYCALTRAQWTISKKMQHLDVLCDMEFTDDFKIFFEPFLQTMPKVGPPAILAYKPEPPPQDIILEWNEEYSACCEFCGCEMKPFPSLSDTDFDPEIYEKLFCCPEFKRLFEYVLHEKNEIKGMAPESDSISIKPHPAFGTEQERLKAKETALRRQQERQMARTFAFMTTEPEEGEFILANGEPKKIESEFLQKQYKDGRKFLTMFPDGTAQIFYPSGNLAAVLVANRLNGLICVIQEDKINKPAIQAIFDSSGKITCYYPNGNIWVNINLLGGQYLDQEGNRVRTWKWPSTVTSMPLISFKPIFLSLNNHTGVRILDQDKIIVSFLAQGQQARMNVGTKLTIRLHEEVPKLRYITDEDFYLLAFIIKIRRLLSKIETCVNFPNTQNWYKLKTPSYLTTHAIKLLSLCRYYELGKEALARIKELLNEPI